MAKFTVQVEDLAPLDITAAMVRALATFDELISLNNFEPNESITEQVSNILVMGAEQLEKREPFYRTIAARRAIACIADSSITFPKDPEAVIRTVSLLTSYIGEAMIESIFIFSICYPMIPTWDSANATAPFIDPIVSVDDFLNTLFTKGESNE